MKTRILKIELINSPKSEGKAPPSYLRLKGYWLTKLGFQPGDRVEIIPESGLLIIRKAP
jgi:hypothetical protein